MEGVLQAAVQDLVRLLQEKGWEVLNRKEINYGCQVVCRDNAGGQTQANIYYSKKKGLSFVAQGKDGNAAAALRRCWEESRHGTGAAVPALQGIRPSLRMGCDESGKGDVFGPLVVAACILTEEDAAQLRALGVRDSKMVRSTQIKRLAETIKTRLQDRYSVQVVMPQEYNRRYVCLAENGKNLNDLLGQLHARNIRRLLSKHKCPCIIVDKFGSERYVLQELGTLAKTHTVIQIPHGEADTAVAAASILAREAFVAAMEELRRLYGMSFPMGAAQGIQMAIDTFLSGHTAAELQQVGKLHFKTFNGVR